MKKGMSWPATWMAIIILVPAVYFVGQALHLDHKTPTTVVATQH